ncbi:MAG: hypothetical protein WCA57_01300, partial [Ilumatobacteraceae bacterium]
MTDQTPQPPIDQSPLGPSSPLPPPPLPSIRPAEEWARDLLEPDASGQSAAAAAAAAAATTAAVPAP